MTTPFKPSKPVRVGFASNAQTYARMAKPEAVAATLFEGAPATSAAQLVAALRADGVL